MSISKKSHKPFMLWNMIVGFATVIGLMWAVYTWAYSSGSRAQFKQVVSILLPEMTEGADLEAISKATAQIQKERKDADREQELCRVKVEELNKQMLDYSGNVESLSQTKQRLIAITYELAKCRGDNSGLQERLSENEHELSIFQDQKLSLETENAELLRQFGLESSGLDTTVHDISYRINHAISAGEGLSIQLTARNMTEIRKSIQIHGPTFSPVPQVRTIDGQEYFISTIKVGQQSTSGRWLTTALPPNGAIKITLEVRGFPSNIRRLDSLEFMVRTDRSRLIAVTIRNIPVE